MFETQQIAEYASIIAVAIIAVVLSTQKILKGWKESSTETNVMKLMHEELERLAEYNKTLSMELGNLQKEIITLSRELRTMSNENQSLHHEVSQLTSEVNHLRELLKGTKG